MTDTTQTLAQLRDEKNLLKTLIQEINAQIKATPSQRTRRPR